MWAGEGLTSWSLSIYGSQKKFLAPDNFFLLPYKTVPRVEKSSLSLTHVPAPNLEYQSGGHHT